MNRDDFIRWAREAMEQAIRDAAAAKPALRGTVPYTKKQLAILERYRSKMAAAGGAFPEWWEYTSAWDLSNIAVKAVQEFKP